MVAGLVTLLETNMIRFTLELEDSRFVAELIEDENHPDKPWVTRCESSLQYDLGFREGGVKTDEPPRYVGPITRLTAEEMIAVCGLAVTDESEWSDAFYKIVQAGGEPVFDTTLPGFRPYP